MAENAVHISSLRQNKPTIFELIAQESLMDTLQPSFSLLCRVFKKQRNTKSNWFFKFQEEWFLLLNFLLQFQYLRIFKGSFSETFYGLRRVPSNGKSATLPFFSKTMSLMSLVLLPYVSLKVKNYIESIQLKVDSNLSQANQKEFIRLMNVYRYSTSLYEVTKLFFLIGYMSGFLKNHSPQLKLANVELVYQNQQGPTWGDLYNEYYFNKKKFSRLLLPISFKFISQILEISAFTVQFINWWHSGEVNTKLNSLPIPAPLKMEGSKNICPLCYKKRRVEVVLPVSGYAFCFRCIKEELEKSGKCPVTNLPATTAQLIRISRN